MLCSAADLMGANLLEEVRAMDECADRAVGSIGSEEELEAKQAEWRAAFLDGIGGLPKERTALNAKEGEVKEYDGFTLQNVMLESMRGVYVVGHLFLPRGLVPLPRYGKRRRRNKSKACAFGTGQFGQAQLGHQG